MKPKKPEVKHTCNKCGYEWKPKTERLPKSCPLCKSYKWGVK